jgi:hypothetical protein
MVSLVMVGLALSMSVSLPSRQFTLFVLGSELTVLLSSQSQLATVMATLVCAGVDAIIRTHPKVYRRPLGYTVTFWVLPSLLTVASLILLPDLEWWGYRIGLIALTAVLLTLVVVSQYRSVDPEDRHHRLARLTLNGIVYVAALVLFVALYEGRVRSAISATGMLVASGMFALELLRVSPEDTGRTWLYAFLVGMLMGELTWALNYNSIDARIGGATLLLVFYSLTGLTQQHLWRRLNRHVVAEFGLVFVVGLAALGGFARWFHS